MAIDRCAPDAARIAARRVAWPPSPDPPPAPTRLLHDAAAAHCTTRREAAGARVNVIRDAHRRERRSGSDQCRSADDDYLYVPVTDSADSRSVTCRSDLNLDLES